jgi:RNA polymerase-binding protein DksA
MNKREMKKYEKRLIEERRRLSSGIKEIERAATQEATGEHAADLQSYAEVGTDNFERETALNIAAGESQRLQDIDDALDRISQGRFGTCEGCDEEIGKKRLEFVPAARYCIPCQEKLERDGYL